MPEPHVMDEVRRWMPFQKLGADLRVSCVVPAYRVTENEIDQIVSQVRDCVDSIVVLDNDPPGSDDDNIVLEGVTTRIKVAGPVGKSEAIRFALEWVLENKSPDIIVQLDGHLKQPPRDAARLISRLAQADDVDMVVANRYDDEIMHRPEHRETITGAFSTIVRAFTGYELVDTVAGMRAYRSELARTFADQSHSFGYGLELEQIFLAHRHGASVAQVGVESLPQAHTTAAEKLEDNLAVLIAYLGHHLTPIQRATLHRIMAGVKLRSTFEIDGRLFEENTRFRFVYAGRAEDDEESYRVERGLSDWARA